jgi:hypothetical protein
MATVWKYEIPFYPNKGNVLGMTGSWFSKSVALLMKARNDSPTETQDNREHEHYGLYPAKIDRRGRAARAAESG